MATRRLLSITFRVMPDTDSDAAKVIEMISRTAVGLGMDGISSDLRVVPYDHDPDEEMLDE